MNLAAKRKTVKTVKGMVEILGKIKHFEGELETMEKLEEKLSILKNISK